MGKIALPARPGRINWGIGAEVSNRLRTASHDTWAMKTDDEHDCFQSLGLQSLVTIPCKPRLLPLLASIFPTDAALRIGDFLGAVSRFIHGA